MAERRGPAQRLGDLAVGCFVAALLLYGAVQLVRAVLWWLVGLAVIGVGLYLAAAAHRYRNDRW